MILEIIPYLEPLYALPGGKLAAFIVLLIVAALAFQIILAILIKIFGVLVGKTKTTLDDRIFGTLSKFLPPISLVTALWIALESVYPDLMVGQFNETELYIIVLIGIVGLLLSALVDQILLWYGMEIRPRKKDVKDEEVFPFVRNVIRIMIILVFAIFILQRLGFDTTAIITGLGIGGLAVALALQDTLANFFAGVHILVDKPFKEDDYIKLENGTEGTVLKIGWRTTRLITPTNNELVVPNSKLAGSILENYSNPEGHSGVTYSIGVDYKEDIDEVEKLITDALTKIAKRNTNMKEKSIWVRFDSFGEYSLNFKFGYDVLGYVNRWAVLKEVNKELFYTFKQNKINIPYPVRVIHQKK
ncbi:Large-conductance mechanosensitive channel MscMJLR [Candidatus Bilamarchaeum dharawalense]|uniref:Large-conductance mechanosensitive channel MscMJLR n=1 Tax=Candidatus Bilamarchaeum dharawalense TaxID=2885759 RepID=A0A5E4LPT6_9ARCH|nr:Large-conductance mechanosensitive channel MscMJLR [Candidatus Bilamarchaeum dharawalense]